MKLTTYLVFSVLISVIVCEENWIHNAVGAPLNWHKDFSKLGVECPEGYIATGIRFVEGGCTDSSDHTKPATNYPGACNSEFKPPKNHTIDEYQGLWVELDCQKLNYPIYEGKWIATGVGSPIKSHKDFTKVGGTCPTGYVVTGLRFQRGGCNMTKSWTDNEINFDICENETNTSIHTDDTSQEETENTLEGLVLELKCSPFEPINNSEFDWKETGFGRPIQYHADFYRIGGHCPGDSVIQGMKIMTAGSSGSDIVVWTQNKTDQSHMASDTHIGLVVVLLCGEPDPTVLSPLLPEAPLPSLNPQILTCSFYNTPGFYPVDNTLFINQISEAMNIAENWVVLLSTKEFGSKTTLEFFVYDTQSNCQKLIDLVVSRDPSLKGTYLGLPGTTLKFYTPPPISPTAIASLVPYAPTQTATQTPPSSPHPSRSKSHSPLPVYDSTLSSENSSDRDEEANLTPAFWVLLFSGLGIVFIALLICIIFVGAVVFWKFASSSDRNYSIN